MHHCRCCLGRSYEIGSEMLPLLLWQLSRPDMRNLVWNVVAPKALRTGNKQT